MGVFVSNGFSFAKGSAKPGTVDPQTTPFIASLRTQSEKLWGHLLAAGAKETVLFACAQMAKWISGAEPKGMVPPAEIREGVAKCCQMLHPGPSLGANAKEVGVKLKAILEEEGVAKVLGACRELYEIALATCGGEHAEYLRRAVKSFEEFGRTLEITDGQHFMALFQSQVPVLHPVKELKFSGQWVGPVFLAPGEEAADCCALWAARDVDVAQSLVWMELSLQIPAAYGLTSRWNSPMEMRVTTSRPPSSYIRAARKLLAGVGEEGSEELPAVKTLSIAGLGNAVYVAANAAVAIQHEGLGIIEKIETAYVDPTRGDSCNVPTHPQIKVTIRSCI